MPKSFYFYDLETSGLKPNQDRIMQFAGIRTDMLLQKIGESANLLVRLNDDTLPSPEATLVTGITPQQTIEEGMSEAEFAKYLTEEVFTPDTIAIGYNNIRFDDEFIRHLLWRNFYDAYEWSYKDGRSRWDLLDVVRMTRALRPEGINWPVDSEGKPTNRLELLTKENGIDHFKAHDALSDVEALIAVTDLIKTKQPKLFEYLFKMRDKKEVQKMVNLDNKQPFVYSSGRLSSEFNKTTVAFPLTAGRNGNLIVYDLRYDPTPFLELSAKEIAAKIFAKYEERQAEGFLRIPVKEFLYNHAPAVAPLSVLDQADGWEKIALDKQTIENNLSILISNPAFAENVRTVFESRDPYPKSVDPEAQLYDGFVSHTDKMRVETVRQMNQEDLADYHPKFNDERLDELLLHYKARNFPKSLSDDEARAWERWRAKRLRASLPKYVESLRRLSAQTNDDNTLYILQELQLWAESIMPLDDDNVQESLQDALF